LQNIELALIENAIKPDDFHFARTGLLWLENTIRGRVLPIAYIKETTQLARSRNLATHLGGPRLFNAEVKLGIDANQIAAGFVTVSICLSKGLGAPVGSLLCGPRDLIKEARRWRKMLGGGMRQAGIHHAQGRYGASAGGTFARARHSGRCRCHVAVGDASRSQSRRHRHYCTRCQTILRLSYFLFS